MWTVEIDKRKDDLKSVPWAHLRLPPFPQIAIRVLQLANNENVQLHQLSDLVSTDAAFSSEVLTIANSVLYSPRYPASSILQAIAVLGANHLQGMCLTVGVRAYMGKTLGQPAMQCLWRHNLACALVAQQLASGGFMDKDIAYAAGVMHDIGRFALSVIRPKEYTALLSNHVGSAGSVLQRERELFGWDHCEVGRQLIVDWKLPVDFESVVSEHHAPRRTDGSWGMAELIKVSCRLADVAGFPPFAGCELAPFAELLDEIPERERKQFYTDVETMTADVTAKIQVLESV